MNEVESIDAAVLTIIDTAGIQDYIFGSNRLRENIGASYLVELATRAWVFQALDGLGANNLTKVSADADDLKHLKRKPDPQLRLEDGQLRAELIYAGGGNTVILFLTREDALGFTRTFSERVLRDAPGLEVVIAHSTPFPWQPKATGLYDQLQALREERLAQKKRRRAVTPTPLLGLGVTMECASTGLVAAQSSRDLEAEERLVSRGTAAKLNATLQDKRDEIRNLAKERLLDYLRQDDQQLDADKFAFSDELDELGRISGEESYIAVVHLDGNAMGKLFDERAQAASDNRDYIELLRNLSDAVERASRVALVKTLSVLRDHIQLVRDPVTNRETWQVIEALPSRAVVPQDNLTTAQQKRFPLFFEEDKKKNPERKYCWPFRPVVFGGDDVTFVCNGLLGLSLAVIFMKAFSEASKEFMQGSPYKQVHTGAGVCIVKVHYPFRRAYDLSAALAKAAKVSLGDKHREASALDWHFSTTGLSGELGELRRREYAANDGSLLMRPVRLDDSSGWRIWENFNRLVAAFNYHQTWAGARNKLKTLREVLRDGGEAVRDFLKTTKTTLPPVLNDGGRQLHEAGWESDRCVYFDALEAMDHHFLLKEAHDDKTIDAEV